MAAPMLCTDCFQTGEADTLLEGSDRLEMLAWCCLAVPGLLYCWWRHALRIKVCAHCGGGDLVRQARAAQLRATRIAPLSSGPRVRNLTGPVRWPRALATPRERLRQGGLPAALASATAFCALLAALGPPGPEALGLTGAALAAACGLWISRLGVRIAKQRAAWSGCRAWDAHGRALRIEPIL